MGRIGKFFAKSRNRMRFAIHDARLATKHDAVTPCRALLDARRTTVVLPAAPLGLAFAMLAVAARALELPMPQLWGKF